MSATLSENIDYVSALNEKVSSFSSEFKTHESTSNTRFNNIESNAQGLQNQIEQLKIATDVIAVFGTHKEFTDASAGDWQQQVTDNDTIKVLNDNDEYQVYYEWHDPNASTKHTDWSGWSAIGSLDPYYNTDEIDEYFETFSSTVSNNYLSANKQAVVPGKNIVVTEKTGPVIEIKTSSNVEFDKINDTSVSSLINSAKSGYAASAYITAHSGDFLNSAHSAYGKLTFGTKEYPATNSSYNFTFSAGKGIGFTTGNNQVTISAEGTTYKAGDYISTANNTISVTGIGELIGSAQSGKRAYDILNSSKISAISPTYTANAFGFLSAGFRISAGDNLIISTGENNTFKLNAKPSIDTTFSNVWYYGADPEGINGTITGITARYNNDVDTPNYITQQEVVFGSSAGNTVSGLLIQAALPAENGNVLTYDSTTNSYTWQPGGTTYTTANKNIVINNGLKTIGLASSVSSNDLHLTGAHGIEILLNGNYISGYYAGSTPPDFTAKMTWKDLLTLNYVSSCNKLGSDGLPVIRVSACSQIPSISEMVEGIYYLV